MPDALEILRDVNPDAVPAAQPPAAANYRPSELAGIACQFCSKFVYTGAEVEEGVAQGYCGQWESFVRGDHVSDAFADPGPPLDEQGNEQWDFAESREAVGIHLAHTDQREEEGFVIKEILRTGEWPVIPTKAGLVKKPLRIIRDGKSNPKEGTIALSEIVQNFHAGAIDRVQIPLSDEDNDHKNITRLNTGYVRDVWIVDSENGSKLVAKMEFTEPEVKEKILRGTYSDVSCGIPWSITSRGKKYGATLEHVCITNRPFIDGLGPFLAMSDKERAEVEVVHFGEVSEEEEQQPPAETPPEETTPETPAEFSAREVADLATAALTAQLGLPSSDYHVADVRGSNVVVNHTYANTTWTVPFKLTATDAGNSVELAAISDWAIEEGETDEPSATSGSPVSASSDPLEQARRLREIRLSQPSTTKRAKESNMPSLTREALDALELSDDARAAIQSVLDENARLAAQTREAEANRRVDELKDLGLSERPGFLKFYRSVMLSDDGGPAVVLSENGTEKESVSALEILDRAVEALKGSDGKVHLSAQALASGNDDPPPADAKDEQPPVEERVAEAREALYGKK